MTDPLPQRPADLPAPPALKSKSGLTRIRNAMRYSMQGFGHAIQHEAAFRQELVLVLPLMVIAVILPLPLVERVVLFAAALLVLIVELLNSAVEAVVDRISSEMHPLSGRAKDLGSAAVFLSIVLLAFAWLVLAGPLLLQLFK
jgi:diacylglycerol kinase (ATP)